MTRDMRNLRFQWAVFPAALAWLCASCAVWEYISPSNFEERGLIIFYRDTSSIAAPDTVLRGQPFSVEFVTYGGGCTRSVARTDVATKGLTSVIQPYNRTTRAGTGCDADLLWLRHVAQVRIDQAGTAAIRVIGEQRGASTGSTNGPAELTRTVVVR